MSSPRRRLGARVLLAGLAVLGCHAAEGEPHDASAGPAQVTLGAVRWYVDYDAALAVARERDLPLWVHFGENPG